MPELPLPTWSISETVDLVIQIWDTTNEDGLLTLIAGIVVVIVVAVWIVGLIHNPPA